MPEISSTSTREEQEHLLGHDAEATEMADRARNDKAPGVIEHESRESNSQGQSSYSAPDPEVNDTPNGITPPSYRVYKRRWFGLVQLVLMNIIVSWDVS